MNANREPVMTEAHLEKLEQAARLNSLPVAPSSKSYHNNDAGRAERFVDQHRHDMRYVWTKGVWLAWDKERWIEDPSEDRLTRMAIEHHRQAIMEAAAIQDPHGRTEALKEAMELGQAPVIKRMLELARVDSRIAVTHDQLDADPFLLGVPGGVIDLRAGRFRPGQREDLITKMAGAPFDQSAKCPLWEKFIARAMDNDREKIEYLQDFAGYTLTGCVSEQCFPFLFGHGKNGKTVFIETLNRVLGEYAQRAPQTLLTASANGREPTHEIARLHGARLVVGSETEEGSRLAENRVKDITGGDTLTGRELYQRAFDFRPVLKLWMFGNHRPHIKGTDEGIWRRIRLIHFNVQIPDAERDPELPNKLIAELPGILQWVLAGTVRWQMRGLRTPETVKAASEQYREDEDTLGDFIGDEICQARGGKAYTDEVYSRYLQWAHTEGMKHPLTQRALTRRLGERPAPRFVLKKGNGRAWFENLALRDNLP